MNMLKELPAESLAYPFAERNGVGVEADVALLMAPPEVRLDDEAQQQARQFARDLSNGIIPDCLKNDLHTTDVSPTDYQCSRTLVEVYQQSVKSEYHTYYLGYFGSRGGKLDLQGMGMVLDTDDFEEAGHESKIASNSVAWYKQELAERLADKPEADTAKPDSEVLVDYVNPTKLLEKFAGIQEYRRLYIQVRHALRKQPATELSSVQQTLLHMYQARINSMAAELYPAMLDAAVWVSGQPENDQTRSWRSQLEQATPIAALMFKKEAQERQELAERMAGSMDYIRNGAARQADGKTLSPVSLALAEMVDGLEVDDAENAPEATLPSETVEYMKKTRWKASDMQALFTVALKEWNLLSDHQTSWQEVDKRSGPAPDGKWQVVIVDKKGFSTVEVSSAKKVMFVPSTFNRKLMQASPAGALPVAAHELTHIYQAEFDEQLAEQVPLAAVKGARYITTKEMGGIVEERAVLAMAGMTRPTNRTYVRAMQTKMAGGNHTEVARAFADAHAGATPEARATAAGKNILRLYRFGRRGGHDSQALDYAEQNLILQGLQVLPQEQQSVIAIAGGSFSLYDLAELHRVGLLELPKQITRRPSEEVMRIYFERFHPKAA